MVSARRASVRVLKRLLNLQSHRGFLVTLRLICLQSMLKNQTQVIMMLIGVKHSMKVQ